MFEVDLLSIRPMLGEAKSRQDLNRVLARLRSESWNATGWPRKAILKAIDDAFIHHRDHYEKMLGGDEEAGYAGSKGIKKVKMLATLGECDVVIDGSLEWDPKPHAYSTRIRFSNYGKIRDAVNVGWLDKARVLLEDNVRVDCDCAAFKYFYRYTASKRGFSLVGERRASKIRNPKGRGAVCKHLEHTLRYLGGNYSTIASAMKRHHEFLHEERMTMAKDISESLTCGSLGEEVNLHGIADVLTGLAVLAAKRGMSKTATTLHAAIAQAGLEGDGPSVPRPAPSDQGPRITPAPSPDR